MSLAFRQLFVGGLLAGFAALLSCCTVNTNPTDAEREATNERGSDAETGKDDIVSIVFSLPAFRYHEESREDFRKRLREASALPQNRRDSGSYLYCPGDGTFPAREFIWDQKTDMLTIRLLGDEVEPTEVHRWKRVQGIWVEQ